MTEAQYDQQLSMFGEAIPALRSVADRALYVMEVYPETRDHDNMLLLQYWTTWNHMDEALGRVIRCQTVDEAKEVLRKWLSKIIQAETITRRRREWQNDKGKVQASKAVQEDRKRKSGQGAGPFYKG